MISYIKKNWVNLDHKPIQDLRQAIAAQLQKNRMGGYKQLVCIGTDSQVTESSNTITVATAIVILRENRGGNGFILKEKIHKKFTIKERMLYESYQSINIAQELSDLFQSEDIDIEIHADINTNPNFKSNVALKEAMGYVLGMNFIFKAKPDAWAGSYVANKFTKN